MAVALKLKRSKKRTPEEKLQVKAIKTIQRENAKVRSAEHFKLKKELRAKRRDARKAKLAKLSAAGKLLAREFVPKDKRVHRVKTHKTIRHASLLKQMRRDRDEQRKAIKEKNRTIYHKKNDNIAARKEATKAGLAPPPKFKVKTRHIKKVVAASKE